ncbi:hypothetical protein SK355_01470 [Candidatus Fukatsuia symbiotica]|uniref:Uncharacterized protein n=1 Tax=Candidatus Fukatsuia symbiotica TaxID=1878942 RepID=A0A2U8I7U9_9GAMM|nr:hypothetical protein [Candidatus Fukatsuia symbiotica]AWK15189.1 hypothetical protein CCS41_13055 [Candidatus Fukatsuia symbiotica]MEA9444021.1 hypothetical protein [Candidatus Fukatsuia symbiotica]
MKKIKMLLKVLSLLLLLMPSLAFGGDCKSSWEPYPFIGIIKICAAQGTVQQTASPDTEKRCAQKLKNESNKWRYRGRFSLDPKTRIL